MRIFGVFDSLRSIEILYEPIIYHSPTARRNERRKKFWSSSRRLQVKSSKISDLATKQSRERWIKQLAALLRHQPKKLWIKFFLVLSFFILLFIFLLFYSNFIEKERSGERRKNVKFINKLIKWKKDLFKTLEKLFINFGRCRG